MSYLAESYNRYVKETDQDLYGTKKVQLPKPELNVVYTGKKRIDKEIISLKKEFFNGGNCPVDIEVKVITLKNSSAILKEYIEFTKKFDENNKKYGFTRHSITKTIEYCENHSILKDYFREYEKEVDNIMDSLYDQKTATKMFGRAQYAKGERKGRREGVQEGIQKGIQRGVLKLFKKKAINAVVAAETLNMTKKEFMELVK